MPSSIAQPPAGPPGPTAPQSPVLHWTGLVTHTDATGDAAISCTDQAGRTVELHLDDDQREALGLSLVAPGADGMICTPADGVHVHPANPTAAEADRDALLDFLRVVHEALAIPFAATIGEGWKRAAILEARLPHIVVELENQLDDARRHTAYLRKRIAAHPATGYITDAQARAAVADGKTWHEAVNQPSAGGA
ncbi:hypothetical protein AB0M87_04820 [Streptomyces sp. NPDC051320]|uniref:hypothetical protein n=1 Tax=Streptomyces sp. NPDC051320 TaxID=3154644 RepID=UPI003439B889